MSRRMRVLGLALLCLAFAATGCGDPGLWSRYRAERDFWRAGRELERIRVNPRLATDEDYARAARAFRRVSEAFPADPWASPAAIARPYGMDIATLSGRAAVAATRFEAGRGGTGAPEVFEAVARDFAAVPPVRREALIALARARQVADQHDAAAAAWLTLWTESEPVDARREQVDDAVLDAPFGAARSLRLAGRGRSADSLLEATHVRLIEEAGRWRGRRPAPVLWQRAAEAGTGAGDHDGALAALRGALVEPEKDSDVEAVVMAIAQTHLDARRPDSALVYTAWAGRDFGSDRRMEAAILASIAWERMGSPDSALVRLKGLLEDVRFGSERWVNGRFRIAEVLERMGRWESARAEYRTLIAGVPSHALGFRARAAIVRHHASAGEAALAQIEARHALEAVDRLLESSRDDSVQVAGRRCRGEVQEAIGDDAGALETYAALWRRYRRSMAAAEAGFKAAAIAERRGDRQQAVTLYRELSEAFEPELREDARRALHRLGAGATARDD